MRKFLAFLPALLIFCLTELQAQVDIASIPAFHKATQAYQSGNMEEARARYQSLLNSYPDNTLLKNNLAVIAARQGNFEKAEKMFRDVLYSNGTIATSYRNLTALYAYRAAQAYRSALLLDAEKTEFPDLALAGPKQSSSPTPNLVARLLNEARINEPIIKDPVIAVATETVEEKSGEHRAMLAALQIWVKAWSKQDVETYLTSYAPSFRGRQKSHEAWRALRTMRLRNPRFIKVSLSNLKARTIDQESASATFLQDYQSNLIKSRVRKRVTLHLIDGKWKISSERISG